MILRLSAYFLTPTQPLLRVLEDITLQYTYPRLDAEVSKHRNHLLKAPFCVHPATGRICVPVDPREVDSFDPEVVPTVGQLLRELDALGDGEGATEGNQPSSSGKQVCYPPFPTLPYRFN